jgi:hypothetical protein
MPVALIDTNVLFITASARDDYRNRAREIIRGIDHGDLPAVVATNDVVAEAPSLTAEEPGSDTTKGADPRGAAGTTLVTPERSVDIEAFDVEVVDPTGTGDTRPLAGLSREAGRVAAAAAALNCTGDGARGGLATRAEVERLITERSSGPGGETD